VSHDGGGVTLVGALLRAGLMGGVLFGCWKLAKGSFATVVGVMPYLHVARPDDAATMVVTAEVVAGILFDLHRKVRGWNQPRHHHSAATTTSHLDCRALSR
jgi:hypothetical protein